MSASNVAQSTSDLQVIVPAVCTLIGAVIGALFGNWDKIFHKDKVVQAPVIDYAPSGDFEQEVRIMLERTGQRSSIEDLQNRMFGQLEANLLKDSPEAENEIKNILGIYREELPSYDDFVAMFIPIWQKYYNVSTIQELNKFYSTNTMREFSSKSKYVMEEYWPKAQAAVEISQQRAAERLKHSCEPLTITPPQAPAA
jgi:hypothetical protein